MFERGRRRWVAALATGLLVLVACGDSGDEGDPFVEGDLELPGPGSEEFVSQEEQDRLDGLAPELEDEDEDASTASTGPSAPPPTDVGSADDPTGDATEAACDITGLDHQRQLGNDGIRVTVAEAGPDEGEGEAEAEYTSPAGETQTWRWSYSYSPEGSSARTSGENPPAFGADAEGFGLNFSGEVRGGTMVVRTFSGDGTLCDEIEYSVPE